MLNSPGEEVAAPPAADNTQKSDVSALQQILLIAAAALYLFGVAWFYVKFPWAALGAMLVAASVIIAGAVVSWRNSPDRGKGT